jgi:eukaryotic-like serine/threonine-protein kinase
MSPNSADGSRPSSGSLSGSLAPPDPTTAPETSEGSATPRLSPADGENRTEVDAPPDCWQTRPPTPDDWMTPLPGQTFASGSVTPTSSGGSPAALCVPGYEILGELGRGGMGVVYKARHMRLKRLVALKMILSGSHAPIEQTARFQAEAQAVARLQHPYIVQIYEVGEVDGLPFFSLEFVNGGSLDKKLARTPLSARTAAQLVEKLSQAMAAAHQAAIIHRDLKPANVLLVGGADVPIECCTPKITDFGLAKQLDDDSAQTKTGVIMGTPSYMAPEQAAGWTSMIGPLSDVYALGAILYECLTGRPPFKAASVMDTLEQVRKEEPVPPSRLQRKMPRDLETICLKCLEKQPHRRYASSKALADDLNRFLDGEPIQARRVRLWERAAKWVRRRPTAAALIGVLVAVALALPLVGLQFSAQLAQKRQAEQKRVNEDRAEIHDLLGRGQTAALSENWRQAEILLDQAQEKVETEPALADLRKEVETVRTPVKDRLTAIDTFQHFDQDRDEALFYATLASGENMVSNRKTARDKAAAALTVVGLSAEGQGALTLGASFTKEEKEEIVAGSYALLLMLAEIESRRLPQQTVEEHRQQVRQALVLLDRADGLGVRTRAIHLRRARYLKLLDDVAGAAKESQLAQALALETDLDPQDHYLVGYEFFSQGELEKSNQEFHRALQLNARHFWTHYFLGICCVTQNKAEVAVAHLTICQSQQPKLIWIYLLRGFAYGQMGDYAAAEADFDRALTLEPSPATLYVLYNNRGVMRAGQKEARAKGVEDLKQAVALRPDQYQAQASLAEAHRLDGRLDEAGKHLDEAIALAGRQVEAGDVKPATLALLHYSRARLHLQRPDREAAIRSLTEAARLAGDDRSLRARADADRGRVLHLQERFEEALAAYDAALKGDPERVVVLRWRGEVLLVQRNYREAAAAFDAYLEKGGARSAAVYRQRALAHVKLGQHAEAIDDYGRALEAKPKDEEKAPLYLNRGQEYLIVNALEPALRDFQEALRLDPNSADAALGCAYVQAKQGEPRKGVADAEKAVKGEPMEPRLWHGAARIYAQAAAQRRAESGQLTSSAQLQYQERAVALLRTALQFVPADERKAYWREQVMKDTALEPLRGIPAFVELAAFYGY